MDEDRRLPRRPWDVFQEVPVIEDEQTNWKLIKLLKVVSLSVVAVLVFGLALCSKTSFLLLITFANEGTKTLGAEQKPVVLLCIGCALITSSVLLLQKSIWKMCYKSAKVPAAETAALVLFFEFMVSGGSAVLTIVAMPHLDIVTNVTIFNGVAVFTTIMQIVSQCVAKGRNRFLLPSIAAFLLLVLGYVLFVILYIMKDPTDIKTAIWVGLAVGASVLVSFNWWETYFKLISENSSSVRLKRLCKDMRRCQNFLHILSSLLRIAVTACVLGAYVPLAKMDWDTVRSIPSRETRIIGITVGVQLVSSALCHWFAVVACKMHSLRRCFILPLYLASLAVMALFVVPVIFYYEDFRISLNGTTSTSFRTYCSVQVDERIPSVNGSVFPELVWDVTHTLCFLDMSKMWDIGILTGSAVSWWLGLVLATLHLWYLSLYRIQRTQDLFIKRLYEGAFLEQSLLLNTRFDIQTSTRPKKFTPLEPVKVFLCATMWHETYEEMMKIIISLFRLDKYRPKKEGETSDVTFEGHIYFDDAFREVPGSEGHHVNEYAEMLVEIIKEVYSYFLNTNKGLFEKEQQVPDQTLVRTPYGGRVVVTMPHGNTLLIHFKDKTLIRHKKRWSQVMYLYYLLGWKVAAKYYKRWDKGEDEAELQRELQKEKHNTYLLALDGDTDFQPAAVMLLIDRLKLYPRVGAACGRIHPTGSGPLVWFQKFEYAVGHWLQKTSEHVFGCVLCSPGCFSLFRAEALMDDNVMKKYIIKASQALHYIQYNQGEDRWLCTLLLKQGWRVEYNAASDAYTNAPEEFKEFFNQRRRWGPSGLANVVDLLGSSSLIVNRNPSMSRLFMLYQLFNLASSILSPSTVVLLIAGSFTVLLNISPNGALVLAVIPPAIFLGVSLKIKSDTQIKIAAILSTIYAFLMMIAAIVIIGNMVKEQTIMSPSSLFIIALASFYLVTAIMHPQEIGLVIYGLLYIICIPSAYLLLVIYTIVNLNNVSWGTRETAPPPGAGAPVAAPPLSTAQKIKNKLTEILTRCRNLPPGHRGDEVVVSRRNSMTFQEEQLGPQPQNTIVVDERIPEIPQVEQSNVEEPPAVVCPNQCWVSQLQSLSEDMRLREGQLDQNEELFFREMVAKYLQPLPSDKKKQEEMTEKLKELRNKITFAYFMCNAMWLLMTFTLQTANANIAIQVPKLDANMEFTGEYIYIEPLGFMFIFSFALVVVIQVTAMLWHRVSTLIHYVAYLDTESKSKQQQPPVKEELQASVSAADASGDEGGDEDEDEDEEDEEDEEETHQHVEEQTDSL